MRIADFDNRSTFHNNQKNKSYYRILDNLSMSYGSAVECFRIWLTNDLKGIANFTHTYIESQFNGAQDFLFREGMLVHLNKPNLSLQYTIDHANRHETMTHPSVNNMEAINVLRSTQYTDSIVKCNDGNDSIDVRVGYRMTKINVTAGIVAQSRSQADNISQYWTYRRQDNYLYKTGFLIDFEIPPYVIDILYNKFKIPRKTHRPMLKWLNKHSSHLVYYGLNTYNGKPRFFVKMKMNPLIRPNGFSNPQGLEEMTLGSEMWTLTRNFDIDIPMPAIIAIKGYSYRDNDYNNREATDFNNDIANALRNKTIEEFEIQIEDKHAITEVAVDIDASDIITLENGTKISNKIDIHDAIESEGLMLLFTKWAKEKGLDESDLYDFVVAPNNGLVPYTTLSKTHTLSEAVDALHMSVEEYKGFIDRNKILFETEDDRLLTINDLAIPNDDAEYEHYIKNSREFWFVDLQPEIGKSYRITIYCSLGLYNQFILETKYSLEDYISADDAHNEYATGKFKELSNPQDRY